MGKQGASEVIVNDFLKSFRQRSYQSICEDILEGMKGSKKAMIKEGLWNQSTTFEEWSSYAGSHCIITEQPDRLKRVGTEE